ncbi:hypothetical protein ACFX13_016863 [Malus domestica]
MSSLSLGPPTGPFTLDWAHWANWTPVVLFFFVNSPGPYCLLTKPCPLAVSLWVPRLLMRRYHVAATSITNSVAAAPTILIASSAALLKTLSCRFRDCMEKLAAVGSEHLYGNGLPQRCSFPANDVAPNLDSHVGILPEMLLCETLKSEIDAEIESAEASLPVNELDSRRRVSK